jgi:NitT/TauT family transport system permease protein
MSDAVRGSTTQRRVASTVERVVWRDGLIAAVTWLAAAAITVTFPDVVPWGSSALFAWIMVGGAGVLVLAALVVPRLRTGSATFTYYGPWLIALGVIFSVWEVTTAKTGWLPKPFFSPPQGLLHAYVVDHARLMYCVLFSLRLWAYGFGSGVVVGFFAGVALGWSRRFAYWGMPLLKLIGPVPATAWIPCLFFVLPTTFLASVFLVAIASGIPVAILTSSSVSAVDRSYYDVARTLGAGEQYLIWKVAVPASLPNVFVGLFMALYYSFAVLVVAEMLGAKYGLGWYLAFETGYSAYANVYATLVIMALLCSGIVKLLFVGRDRLLSWQRGII